MKLIDSGVTFSAAMQRSPSFSRSSSSTMITNSPRRYSSAASSTVAKGMGGLYRGLLSCCVTELLGCRVTKLPGCQKKSQLGNSATWQPDNQGTQQPSNPPLPRHLKTLLHRVRLLRHGVDDLHFQ